jgi:hypothetical protein
MPATNPLINGVNYSWANVIFTLFGVPVVGITDINYNRKQKKENNYGFGQQPISRGYGNYEYSGDIELYLDEWKNIISASPNNDPLTIAPFDIVVLYGSSAINSTKDVLKSVEFLEDPFAAKQGDTKLLVKIPLIIAAINR